MAKMKFDLSALRKRVEAERSGGSVGTYFSPAKLPDDTTVNIRFLPLADGSHWRVQHLFHKIPGATDYKVYTCPTMEGKPCPFCERAQKYYAENNDDMGSLYWRKKRFYANILIRENAAIANFSELTFPLTWGYGVKIEDKLAAGLADEDIGTFFEQDEGYDFRLHKKTVKDWANYDDSTFARKSTPTCKSDAEWDKMIADLPDLNAKINAPLSYDELVKLMSGVPAASSSPLPPVKEPAAQSASAPAKSEPAKMERAPEPSNSDTLSEEEEVAKLLAEIESKQK